MRVPDKDVQQIAKYAAFAGLEADLACDLLDARRECADLVKALRMMTDLATHQSNTVDNLRRALGRIVKSGGGTFRDLAREALAGIFPFKASP